MHAKNIHNCWYSPPCPHFVCHYFLLTSSPQNQRKCKKTKNKTLRNSFLWWREVSVFDFQFPDSQWQENVWWWIRLDCEFHDILEKGRALFSENWLDFLMSHYYHNRYQISRVCTTYGTVQDYHNGVLRLLKVFQIL